MTMLESASTRIRFVRLGWIRRLVGKRAGRTVGATILGVILLMCIFVPIFSPYSVDDFVGTAMQSPSLAHPFGTDIVGRDVFVRTFDGGRLDFVAAIVVVVFNALFGTAIGVIAGAAQHRWVDTVLMRIVDAILSIPAVVLILAIVLVVGSTNEWGPLPAGLPSAMIALMATGWAFYARLARGQALVYRESDFIVASQVAGLSQGAIVIRHIFPGVGRLSISYAVGDAVSVVVLLASLPYLGAGVQPPAPEWGSIMYEGRGFLQEAWWITIFPGVILALTGLGLSFLSDSLLDSREK